MSEEILHLLKSGFPGSEVVGWRFLYEIAVNATFDGLRGGACVKAYLNHVLRCHQFDLELQAATGTEPLSNFGLNDLERDFQEMLMKRGDFLKFAFGWTFATL